MVDLKALAATIKQLSPEEREQLERLVEKPQGKQSLTPAERIEGLRKGRDKFREGISDEEMREIAKVMNTEFIKPEGTA
ncbi:MAG: hypothetical protein H7X77_02790 [Anaerolineae bacterium]|nr:hypothetical protein [Anaerolineae bacterium]